MTREQDKQRSTSLSALVVMVATLFSRMLGFVKVALISHLFGATGKADVFNFVFDIPNNLRKLMAEGALSSAFIPTLSQSIADKNGSDKRLVRTLLTFQFLILIPLCVLAVIFKREVILFLSEYEDPDRIELAASLFQFFIHYILFVSISAVIMATLNSRRHFLTPALAPIVFSVCVIISVLAFHKKWDIFSMALGVLSGGVAQILIQLPVFYKKGYRMTPDFHFRDPYFRTILRRWVPVLFASCIFFVNQLIANKFASGLDDGSVSALKNSIIFWQLPQGIFGASLSTVLFPKMSREAVENDTEGLRRSVNYGLTFLYILLIPSSLILILFGPQMVAVTLQHGKFTLTDSILTARVLSYYSFGLFFSAGFTFLQRFFYSRQKFFVPVAVSIVLVLIDIGCSLWLKETALRVSGLALANSVSFAVAFFIQLYLVKRELHHIGFMSFLKEAGKGTLAMIPFTAYLVAVGFLSYWKEGFSLMNFATAALVGIGAVLILFFSFYLFKIEILTDILKRRRKSRD